MIEEWKRLNYRGKDFGDFYLVSSFGEIKGVKMNKIRRKNINPYGYYYVSVSLGSRSIKPCFKMHVAVADTFIGYNGNEGLVINHMDGNKLNNCVSNLEYCTNKENLEHAIINGLRIPIKRRIRLVDLNISFESIADAGRYINKNNYEKCSDNISRALRKKATAYGYRWEYL